MNARAIVARALRCLEAAYWWCAGEYRHMAIDSDGNPYLHQWSRITFFEMWEIWAAFFSHLGIDGWTPVVANTTTIAKLQETVEWFNDWALTWMKNNDGMVWRDYLVEESDDATIVRFSDGAWAGFDTTSGDWAGLEATANYMIQQPWSDGNYEADTSSFSFWFPSDGMTRYSRDGLPGYIKEQFLLHDLACKAWLLIFAHKLVIVSSSARTMKSTATTAISNLPKSKSVAHPVSPAGGLTIPQIMAIIVGLIAASYLGYEGYELLTQKRRRRV